MDTNFCVEDTPLTKHAKTIGSTHIFNGSQYLILKSLEQNYLFTRRRIDEEFSKDLFSKEFFKQKESSKGS
jgi:shikimate 5-dehydrogenase